MSKKPFVKKPMFGVDHFGGRKFSQPGAEYIHKEKEVRKHRTGGRPRGGHWHPG